MTINLPFEAKIRKVGNSHIVTVPNDYIKHNILKKGQKCKFIIIGT